jgi:hypothetical protein
MFYVDLDELTVAPGVDMPFDPGIPKPLAEKMTERSNAEPAGTVPSANPEPATLDAPPSSGQTVDMSVGNLDAGFDEFEDIQLDTSEIDRDIDFASYLSSTAEIVPPFDNDAASRSEERNADTETGRVSDPDVGKDRENT